MRRIAALILTLAFLPSLVRAQDPDPLVISGIVREFAGDASVQPVPGAEVTISADDATDILATIYTGANGAFEFHASHPGLYLVKVKKDGYSPESPSRGVAVDPGHSPPPVVFSLSRPGELTGRVIDEDGKPVAGLSVTVQRTGPGGTLSFLNATAVTADDGTFTATDVRPGPYLVHISPRSGDLGDVVPQYSEGDLKIVDEDLETTYWPGGFSEPSSGIPVNPGGAANIGTIKIRTVSYYRVHVSVSPAECESGETWTFAILDSGNKASRVSQRSLPCTKDVLVRNLRPGSYWFMVRKDEPDPGRWALTTVDVSTKNIDVALQLEPEAEIIGRILAADGATLPPLDKIGVSTKPAIVGFAGGGLPVIADAEGKFVLRNLKFPRHQVILTGLPRQYYVKEIRFNGAPSPDWQVTLSPGVAQLEIVIDDKPGTISGTATDGDKPAGQALVILLTPSLQPAQPPALTDPQGNFQFTGIVPGEYRAIAVSRFSTRPEDLDAVTQLAAHTETIRVERGGTSTISLTLAAP